MSALSEPTLAKTIEQILISRKPRVAEAEKVIARLNAALGVLKNFQSFLSEVAARDIPAETKDKIYGLNNELGNFVNVAIPTQIQELYQLRQRFKRETVNIGIVGNAGQGKSRLLQSLTGLQDSEIPTGSGGRVLKLLN
jgi:ABC-type transport system involved in cytochrome bd biosynthesis fused ATPase/permease subunit